MQRCNQAADLKSMSYVQLNEDQPVYALIEEVKHENPVLFEKFFPVLGGFHTACTFLATVYRRFKGSGLEDIAISDGTVKAGSAETALKVKHYNRGMRIHKLINEVHLWLMTDQLKELNPPDSSITSKLNHLEGNSSNTTSFQEKFNNIFNDNDVHQYKPSCLDTISNMNSPIANLWLS